MLPTVAEKKHLVNSEVFLRKIPIGLSIQTVPLSLQVPTPPRLQHKLHIHTESAHTKQTQILHTAALILTDDTV